MVRLFYLFILTTQLAGAAIFAAFLAALIFRPEAIGAVPAKIIVGFQHAYESGKQ
jgi:hypothetical protein